MTRTVYIAESDLPKVLTVLEEIAQTQIVEPTELEALIGQPVLRIDITKP